jgi:hypothetical protein
MTADKLSEVLLMGPTRLGAFGERPDSLPLPMLGEVMAGLRDWKCDRGSFACSFCRSWNWVARSSCSS